jgi:hypothetical protein
VSEPLPPTARQLALLRRLATERGETFTWPGTRRHASREIARLMGRTPSDRVERELDRRAVVLRDNPLLPASSVRDDETVGWGSNCRWLHTMR